MYTFVKQVTTVFIFIENTFKNNHKYNTLKECKETYINSVITA